MSLKLNDIGVNREKAQKEKVRLHMSSYEGNPLDGFNEAAKNGQVRMGLDFLQLIINSYEERFAALEAQVASLLSGEEAPKGEDPAPEKPAARKTRASKPKEESDAAN